MRKDYEIESLKKEIDRLTSERNNAEMREYKMLGHANAANKRLKEIESAMCEVMVSVAVSDSGVTECCIADSGCVQQQQKHREWMDKKRESKSLWGIKTFRVNVPIPLTFEDMASD